MKDSRSDMYLFILALRVFNFQTIFGLIIIILFSFMNTSSTRNNLELKREIDLNQDLEKKSLPQSVSFRDLFRFAKTRDILFMGAGGACSLLIGGAIPLFSLLWGNMTNSFKDSNKMVEKAFQIFIQYIIFGCIAIFAGWGKQYFWNAAAQSQANQCRKSYLEAIIRQEIGWFQTQQSSEIVSRFMADSSTFQQAIGQKIALVIYLCSMFLSGIIISFLSGWEMTLVVLAFEPLLIFSFWLIMHHQKKRSQYEEEIFQGASGIAQEAIQSIKIVKQLNGQDHQIHRFQEKVSQINKKSFSFNIKMSLGEALCLFTLLATFTLAFWYGSQCIQGTSSCPHKSQNPYEGGTILTIFFCLLMPAVNLNQFAPTLKSIAQGKSAAKRIFNVIDRKPLIQSGKMSISAQIFKGVFRFEGVDFAYPKDKTKIIFQNLNLQIRKNNSAMMGQSGCGKSTILQLMMRFYDPDQGIVTLDGVNIKELDLQWLRQQIGYVGQEPLLFSATIKENMLIGNSNATNDEIFEALKRAQILDLVLQLSNKLETYVGNGGSQLSGGQKQRIAIARTLLKNPPIILLDEATSALDRRNERLIQQTLNKITTQKMAITIAHRFKTIMDCDQIIVLRKGKVLQQDQLSELKYMENHLCSKDLPIQENDQFYLSSPSKNTFDKLKNQISQKSSLPTLTALESQKYLMPTQCNINTRNHAQLQTQSQKIVNVYKRFLDCIEANYFIIFLGIVSSIVTGVSVPSMGIHVGRIVTYSLMYETNPEYYTSAIRGQCFYMLITCFIGGLAVGLQYHIFLNIGCKIVNKIRQDVFRKIIKFPLAWFQNKENYAQQISVKLGADIFTINHIISRYFAHFCGAFSNVLFGLSMAFYFDWRTALISIGLIPLIGLVGVVQAGIMSGYINESQGLYEQSAKILVEAINNIKTVMSFCYEKSIVANYAKKLEVIKRKQLRKKIIAGFVFGLAYFVIFVVNGVLFYVSSLFIRDNNLDLADSFSAILLVLFAGIMAGNNIKYIPDFSQLKVIGGRLFAIIDQLDEEEIQRRTGSRLIEAEIKGNISFRNVIYRYESRDELALRKLSFNVSEGEKLGIVGSSGCGKSTVLKLLLGFYPCQEGEIFIDGVSISDYNVHCLRKYFGTVSQEPELFNDTVEYNIAYNLYDVSQEQIYAAAHKSKLIASMIPTAQQISFLKRKVGPRGSHLSGGQKQRVAIARAILRNPKVLLLDEATSALDRQNEEFVQQSLDVASADRTVLNVTHKLERLSNASRIILLHAGQAIEEGSFDELIVKKENFYRLLHGLEL